MEATVQQAVPPEPRQAGLQQRRTAPHLAGLRLQVDPKDIRSFCKRYGIAPDGMAEARALDRDPTAGEEAASRKWRNAAQQGR